MALKFLYQVATECAGLYTGSYLNMEMALHYVKRSTHVRGRIVCAARSCKKEWKLVLCRLQRTACIARQVWNEDKIEIFRETFIAQDQLTRHIPFL